jgi:repressor LexA
MGVLDLSNETRRVEMSDPNAEELAELERIELREWLDSLDYVLEKEGRIHRDPEIFRSIRLSQKKNSVMVHVLGTIAAGTPIPVPNSDSWAFPATETLEIPQDMIKDKPVFALKVKGHSMIDALIDDGDIVLMETAVTAVNGEMVAVWLKDREEVTLKKFYTDKDKVLLKPANQSMKPIQQNPDNVEIQGKVIGVIRKL